MILHVVPWAARGGVEKNCFHFIKSMPGLQHRVVVLGGDGPMVSEWKGVNAKVDVLDIMKLKFLQFRSELAKRLPDEQLEKIIVWTNNRMVIVANALNKYRNATLLFHIGNPVPPGGVKDKIVSLLFPSSNRILIRAVSQYVLDGIQLNAYYRQFPAKVSLKPIEVTDHRTTLKSTDNICFGIVARLDRMKDHRTITSAIALISKKLPNATLEIAGEGPLMDDVRRWAKEDGIDEKTTFHGDVADVPSLISNWDIFLYATTPVEGLGGTVPEALAVGLPVVATDLPMIREWDNTSKYIRWCKPADPESMAEVALSLVADVDHRRFVYENGPAYIRDNFSPKQFSIRYLAE
ncbi:MAG: glycosyltransferase [Bacteroidota bacterium]